MRQTGIRAIAVVVVLVLVAGCSGGGGSTTASGGPAQSQAAATTGVQASGVPATAAPASVEPASAQPAAGGGAFPSDPCQLVAAADVTAIYGGSVKALGLDENGACAFEIEGKAKAGQSVAAGEFAVSFGDEWSPYDTAKLLFGDAVTKVDGLGTEAYSVGGFIHAKVGTGDLIVGGVWVGDYDRALLASEDAEMTKLLLARL
ncbi:MAG TPA: hypothetical protein VGK16_14980 [Candidatus Limnocylindrales bacterium]|jgi:hypothetical protein